MASENPQKVADDTGSEAFIGETGSLNFLGDDPRPLNYTLEGWALPPKRPRLTSWETHIANLRSLQLRDDDIFLCAYPKAGA